MLAHAWQLEKVGEIGIAERVVLAHRRAAKIQVEDAFARHFLFPYEMQLAVNVLRRSKRSANGSLMGPTCCD